MSTDSTKQRLQTAPCTPTRALGRPVARGRSPGRMPSGYAAPGDAVAAPVRARSSPGGHTLQHLPKASRRRKPQAGPCRPRGAVPRVVALQGVAVDVPARKVGEESAREKASVRQRSRRRAWDRRMGMVWVPWARGPGKLSVRPSSVLEICWTIAPGLTSSSTSPAEHLLEGLR